MQQVLKANDQLLDLGITANVWSVTSYSLLYRDAIDCEAWNRRHATRNPRVPYIVQALRDASGIFVAASDYMKLLPASIARWVPGRLVCLGTDGFGLCDTRDKLREYFDIGSKQIVAAVLNELKVQ